MAKPTGSAVAEPTEPTDTALELHKEGIGEVTASYKGIDFIPDSWEEVAEAFEGDVIEFQGSPWQVVDKDTLIGVPFMICDVRFSWSNKFDGPFVNILALTKDNQRIVINDGSTGIMEQTLFQLQKDKRKAGIICPNGLRRSDYKVTVHDGMSDTDKEIEASTYYIA